MTTQKSDIKKLFFLYLLIIHPFICPAFTQQPSLCHLIVILSSPYPSLSLPSPMHLPSLLPSAFHFLCHSLITHYLPL